MLSDKYFTITQAAQYTGFTRQTISRWVKMGKLTSEKVGREVLIKKDEVGKVFICPTCGARRGNG